MKSFFKFLLLLGFWFLLSGSADWQHVLVGVIVAALLMLFWRQPDATGSDFNLKAVGYGLWLGAVMLAEIWKSAWSVARIVLTGCKVDPQLIWIDFRQHHCP